MVNRIKNKIFKLLRASEKWTNTDMVYLAKGGFWIGLNQVLTVSFGFFLALAFANFIPKEVFGSYKYILSFMGIFSIFTLPGMNTAIARATAKGQEGVIHKGTINRIKMSLLGCLVAICVSFYYYQKNNNELAIALAIIALTLPLFKTFTTYVPYLNGKRRFDLNTKYDFIIQTISFLFLSTVLFLSNSLTLILLAYFVPIISSRIVIYYIISRKIQKKVDKKIERETLVYGSHLTFISVLNIISENIDKILLWKFLGPIQLAVYSFALSLPREIKSALGKIGEIAFPKFAAQSSEQISKNFPGFKRKLLLYTLIIFLISIIYILSAPFIFKIILPQYEESVKYSQLIALSLFTAIQPLLVKLLEAQRKIKEQYIVQVSKPILLISLFATLIPKFGIIGAISALVLIRTLFTLITIFTVF